MTNTGKPFTEEYPNAVCTAARVESSLPIAYRLIMQGDGNGNNLPALQGLFTWTEGSSYGAELAEPESASLEQGAQQMQPFVVRHYTEDERPTIKGNGFDGLEIGEDREEAEAFVAWINEKLARLGQ